MWKNIKNFHSHRHAHFKKLLCKIEGKDIYTGLSKSLFTT